MPRRPRQFKCDITLDLHGMDSEEARRAVMRILRSSPGKSVAFIHGCGSGVLRKVVRDILRDDPGVADVLPGEEFNLPGFDGVTVAYLS